MKIITTLSRLPFTFFFILHIKIYGIRLIVSTTLRKQHCFATEPLCIVNTSQTQLCSGSLSSIPECALKTDREMCRFSGDESFLFSVLSNRSLYGHVVHDQIKAPIGQDADWSKPTTNQLTIVYRSIFWTR